MSFIIFNVQIELPEHLFQQPANNENQIRIGKIYYVLRYSTAKTTIIEFMMKNRMINKWVQRTQCYESISELDETRRRGMYCLQKS